MNMLKAFGESAIDRLTKLVNKMYESGQWPEDFLKVIMVPMKLDFLKVIMVPMVSMKNNVKYCKGYRTISLICHTTKASGRIIINGIERKIERMLDNKQFGFLEGERK